MRSAKQALKVSMVLAGVAGLALLLAVLFDGSQRSQAAARSPTFGFHSLNPHATTECA